MVSTVLGLYLNYCFRNRILLFIVLSRYPIVLKRLCGPRSRLCSAGHIVRALPGTEPGTLGWYSAGAILNTAIVSLQPCLVARLTAIYEVPGSIPGYAREIFVEV